ncbi:Glutaryl-Coa Dehydrogenase [Manis pentadactyla]|nr:Glutaryl-Coa Dehydrogenase [Manis pentadactyla]
MGSGQVIIDQFVPGSTQYMGCMLGYLLPSNGSPVQSGEMKTELPLGLHSCLQRVPTAQFDQSLPREREGTGAAPTSTP